MSVRGQLRKLRPTVFARCCAGVLIALVLCPFTAPFASYDPNASPISLLVQDGSLFDKACDKAVSVVAVLVAVSAVAAIAPLNSVGQTDRTIDLLLQRSMVLRV